MDSVATPEVSAISPRRMSRLFAGVGCFAFLAAGVLIFSPLSFPYTGQPQGFYVMAHVCRGLAIAYLLSTVVLSFWQTGVLGNHAWSRNAWSLLSSAHAIVFLAAGITWLRGPDARSLFASLDEMLPALAMVAGLSWGASFIDFVRWRATYAQPAKAANLQGGQTPVPSKTFYLLIAVLILMASSFAVSLAYLEFQPLPHEWLPDGPHA